MHARNLPSAYLRAALPAYVKLRRGRLKSGSGATTTSATNGVGRQKRRRGKKPYSSKAVSLVQEKSKGAFASNVGGSISDSSAETFSDRSSSMATTAATNLTTANTAELNDRSCSVEGKGSCKKVTRVAESQINNNSAGDGGDSVGHPRGGEISQVYNKTSTVGSVVDSSHAGDTSVSLFCSARHAATDELKNIAGDGAGATGGYRAASREDNGSAGWERVWDIERTRRGLAGDACSRFPGSLAHQDLPSALEETVERLCAAAFLRGHVPAGLMPSNTSPDEAYQR